MALDFPGSPINGQTFNGAGSTWTYDGTKWKGSGGAGGGGLSQPLQQYSSNSSTSSSLALAAADIAGGSVEHVLDLTGGISVSSIATLPTVAALVAAISGVAGQSYKLRISNNGNAQWTVAANTGWTLSGVTTLSQRTFTDYIVTLVTTTTATLRSI